MVSQAAVSMHLQSLEQELGVVLFERRGRRIALNTSGETLYRQAMALVQGMDRFPDNFAEQHRGEMRGSLIIGAGQTSAAYLLPKYVRAFRTAHPLVGVEIRLGTGSERLDWLRAYELDIVVAAADAPAPDLEIHPIWTSKSILITPVDHPLAGRDSVALEAAAAYPFVGHAPTQYTRRLQDMLLGLQGIVLDIVVEVDGWSAIAKYVAAGVGIAIVPELCLAEHDRVSRIAFDQPVPQRHYGVIIRRDELIAGPVRRLLQLMIPKVESAVGTVRG